MSGGNQGIGFAVPVNLARYVMDQFLDSGKVRRGYLGIGLQPEISSDLAQEFKLPSTKGAMAAEVVADSPAAKAGFKEGDVVVEFNGKTNHWPKPVSFDDFANCAEHQSDFQK